MTIVFLPDFSDTNPYQTNLADAVATQDEPVGFGARYRFLPILRSVVSHRPVSVVHFHWFAPYIHAGPYHRSIVRLVFTAVELIVLRLAGIPIVWTVHNLAIHESSHPRLEWLFKHAFVRFGFCDRLILHCEAMEDDFIDTYRLSERVREKIRITPHGHYLDNYENDIGHDEARRRLNLETGLVFLFFGRIRPYKGILELIDAYRSLPDADSHLLIVGNPEDEELAAEIEERTGDDDRIVTRLKYVPDEDVQLYMNAADVVVLPFKDITTSGSAILAMTFGKAVVVPRKGCLPELLDENGTIFYRSDGEDALAEALRTAQDRDLASMGEYNRRRVRQYDWAGIGSQTVEIYAEVK